MKQVWDLAVVGAGPAGAAAALTAARAGASVVLLEKASVPRYKRCGGGLIGPSRQALVDLGVEPVARDTAFSISMALDGRREFTRVAPEPFLPLVLRSELDAALTAAGVDAGVALRTGVTVGAYAEEAGTVTLGTSEGPVWARHVVAADGSASRAASYVGVLCDQVDLGLECEVPAPTGWDGHVHLDWGPVPGSYGWVFPKGDSLTVGVIGARSSGEALRDYYRAFVDRLGLDRSTATEDGGHLTRVRAPGSPLERGRVLVAGDAAGLLEPWTREGISFALRSGVLAGRAVTGGMPYTAAVQTALGEEVDAGRRALAAFTAKPWLVHEVMRRLPSMWPLFVDLVSGRTTMAEQVSRRRVQVLLRLAGG